MGIKVNIGGDFCITPEYVSKELFSDELKQFFKTSDLNILNLECPITEKNNANKILKTGPHLHTPKEVFSQLRKINVHAVTLANNHILDFGQASLENTLLECRKENIRTVGAGRNLAEASKPAFIKLGNLQIALINFCENEWSVATNHKGGANPLDIIDNLKQIKAVRKSADFVLVIIHGGHENYNLPSPRMVKQYRFFAENGADAVIGHHTHCISGYEIYKNVPIFYSLGNMIFTKYTQHKGWNSGLIVQLELDKDKPVQFELYPTKQSAESFQLSLLNGTSKKEVMAQVDFYSQVITNNNELLKQWETFVQSKKETINLFSPLAVLPWKFPKLFDRLGFNRILIKKSNLVKILNQIRCEAHRDLTTTLIRSRIKK